MTSCDKASITVVSYNCRGYNAVKRNYVNNLLSTADILCLQEHWLSESQLSILGTINDNFTYAGVSGFDSSKILQGRPYGGCAIMWRCALSVRVDIMPTSSRRVFAIRISNNDWQLLLLCVYMPYEGDDTRTDCFVDELGYIECLINDNPDCHVIMCGDFNVDFSRDWLHTVLLNSFCDNMGIKPTYRHPNYCVNYTYNFNMERFGVLDHFLVSDAIYVQSVHSIRVLHDTDNLSDHDPIALNLSVAVQIACLDGKAHISRPSWQKATDRHLSDYRTVLADNLARIAVPTKALQCRNVACTDADHHDALDIYVRLISHACAHACNQTIPLTSHKQVSGHIAGWSDRVQPFKKKSKFWQSLWIDNGRPRNGPVADCMRRARAAYHYAIRHVRREQDHILNERLAQDMLANDNRDFWAEIKRIRASRRGRSSIIDGVSSSDSVAELFAATYKELYTSVSYDNSEMGLLIDSPQFNFCEVV